MADFKAEFKTRWKSYTVMYVLFLTIAVWSAWYAFIGQGPRINLVNQSGGDLQDIWIDSGFPDPTEVYGNSKWRSRCTKHIPNLKHEQSRRVQLRGYCGTGIYIAFSISERRYERRLWHFYESDTGRKLRETLVVLRNGELK